MNVPPAWERLRSPESATLRVEHPESVASAVLDIADGALPAFDDATVINAWRAATGGYVVWAVRIDAATARTYAIEASALRVRAADAALARLIGFDPAAPPSGIEWNWERDPQVRDLGPPELSPPEMVCPCEGITRDRIEAAISGGARSVDGVKRATKATFGACQSRLCAPTIAAMLGLASDEPRAAITPRPPLVPVPASVLAAFVTVRAEPS